MGIFESKAPQQPNSIDKEINPYQVENLANMRLTEKMKFTYLWYGPDAFNKEIQQIMQQLNKIGFQIKGVGDMTSVKSFIEELSKKQSKTNLKIICGTSLASHLYKKLISQPKVLDIFIYSNQNMSELQREKFNTLRENNLKIKIIVQNIQGLVRALRKGEEFDEKNAKKQFLIMICDDRNLFIRYSLNYHCLTIPFNKEEARQDYIKFIKYFYGQNYPEQVKDIQKNYLVNHVEKQKRVNQTLHFLKKNPLFWLSTHEFPKPCSSQLELAYLRLAVKDIREAISAKYAETKEYVKQKKITEVFILADLKEEIVENLDKYPDNFLMFTSFKRASTDDSMIEMTKKRNKQKYKIRINLKSENLDEGLDFGYWIDTEEYKKQDERGEDNVYFNLFNLFQITMVDKEARNIHLQYGSLAQISEKSKKKMNLTKKEEQLFISYESIEERKKQIRTQASFLLRQKLSKDKEKLRASIRISNESLRFSLVGEEAKDQHRIQTGYFYLFNEDYAQAQKEFQSVKSEKERRKARIGLANISLQTFNPNFPTLIPQLKEDIKNIQDKTQAIKGISCIGFYLQREEKYKEAIEYLEEQKRRLKTEGQIKLKAHKAYHDIYIVLANCYKKVGDSEKNDQLSAELKEMLEFCHGKNSYEYGSVEDNEFEELRQSNFEVTVEEDEPIRISYNPGKNQFNNDL